LGWLCVIIEKLEHLCGRNAGVWCIFLGQEMARFAFTGCSSDEQTPNCMKRLISSLTFVGISASLLGQGTVNFQNTSGTVVRTNAMAVGGTAGNVASYVSANSGPIFYYALFTAPSGVTTVNAADLLGGTWSFTGIYATNTMVLSGGRAAGGQNVATQQGWPAGITNSYAIVGWSASVAGKDWNAVAAQLPGASFNQGIWSGPNWNWTSLGGFFCISPVAFGAAGGGITAIPAFSLFGAGPTPAGTPITSGFDLYIVSDPASQIAPQFTTQPTNQTVVAEGTATLNSQAYGTPAPIFQWRLNGSNLP